jgi:hypothetical protein
MAAFLCNNSFHFMLMNFKLYLFAIIILVFFTACNKPISNNVTTDNYSLLLASDSMVHAIENPNITAFRNYIHQLDSSSAKSMDLSLKEFKRIFTNKSTGLCDTAYLVYQQFIDTIELKINDKLLNDTTQYMPLFTSTNAPQELVNANKELIKYGFKYVASEGQVYIEQDRSYVLKNLLSLFSESMKTYLQQIEKENREGFMADASIVIQPKQHVDRIIWYENFISDNPDFILIKNCKSYKKAYLTYLFSGIDNTRLFADKEKMILSPYFINAYNYVLKAYSDSEVATLLKPLSVAIEQKQLSVVTELLKKYTIKGLIFSQNI